jgi:hypothetical protein
MIRAAALINAFSSIDESLAMAASGCAGLWL